LAAGKRAPGLAVLLVGDDSASQVYVGSKIKACQEAGIESFEYRLPKTATFEDIRKTLDECVRNSKVDGILVQLPLPAHIDSAKVIDLIPPEKDADCLTAGNLGILFKGQQKIAPCTPSGVMEILKFYGHEVSGKSVVVVGRSQIVGMPMAQLMIQASATVTVVHSKTKNIENYLMAADIVVVAAGKPRFLDKKHFKKEAIVVDVGIHRDENNKLCGDVNTEGLDIKALTPVPGGVGPMTIAMLLKNTVTLYKERHQK
ncbi:MAG: bifunctional 5,10-methylenetetrahydrofolate dehydrogenase/5,10-methenyltetrahydrofolate cyclohydrolase, partial [Bdellovibrionaceae bacterium]|nr:bifunctional 5,10-methylenetetrahydrofolate dehydrogenase/5,10-methenyltetrahydrofolate cyclohydrolase [Pseudobdellovibrionaceae bacterium]